MAENLKNLRRGSLNIYRNTKGGRVTMKKESSVRCCNEGVDYRSLVSKADLVYHNPVVDPCEGQPLGNGRMGTLVWTTPQTIEFQINRSDVFAVNRDHAGLPGGPADSEPPDYCQGCAAVTIDIGGMPFGNSPHFQQHLSLYEATGRIAGNGVNIRCFISSLSDVLVLEVDDLRVEPLPLRVTLSMWRGPEVITGKHSARYEFQDVADTLAVVQKFREKDYYCASAVAVQVVGRRGNLTGILGSQLKIADKDAQSQTVIIPAKKGKSLVLIASAATWTPQLDVGEAAIQLLKNAADRSYDVLFLEHTQWWLEFWSRTFIDISSSDGVADMMVKARYLHLYLMAATSRGALPVKFNGMLFNTEGDTRGWGCQYWIWTTEMLYFPLFAADAIDLTEPYFSMYLKQLPDCEKASLQRWNIQGAYYGETTPFDGPVILPEDVAQEFQDVYRGRKSNTKLSQRARTFGQYDWSLAVFANYGELARGRYTYISHIISSGSELAVQAWWRYRYTGDLEWLRNGAYPLLRGAVEFYRHFAKKGGDGCYHIYETNQHEDFWGVNDGIVDLAAIRGTVPLAIKAAEILKVDPDLRSAWRDFLKNLAPYPMGSDPQSQALTGGVLADDVWAVGHLGEGEGHRGVQADVQVFTIFPFEDWTMETHCPVTDAIVHKILPLLPRHLEVLEGKGLNTIIRVPIAMARAGKADILPSSLVSLYEAMKPLPNGLSLFEGYQAMSAEHLGCIATTIQDALLQGLSPRPGEPEVISVFPAWPEQWKASFRLLARGGFMVTSTTRTGKVQFLEIESRLGEVCRLRNPWPKSCVVTDSAGAVKRLEGDIIEFETTEGQHYQLKSSD